MLIPIFNIPRKDFLCVDTTHLAHLLRDHAGEDKIVVAIPANTNQRPDWNNDEDEGGRTITIHKVFINPNSISAVKVHKERATWGDNIFRIEMNGDTLYCYHDSYAGLIEMLTRAMSKPRNAF